MFHWVSAFKDYPSIVTVNMVKPQFKFDDVLVDILYYAVVIL